LSHASRKDIRTAFTLVAFICDDAALQPRLSQVVLAPRGFVLARDAPSIVARMPRNIYVVRRRSAWMDLPMMIQVIRLHGEILQPMLHAITPVLIMDACKVHFAEPVVRACCRSCIILIIVPARMTWLLQPCDTHAFHRFKLELRSLILAERARAVDALLAQSRSSIVCVKPCGGCYTAQVDHAPLMQMCTHASNHLRPNMCGVL
jgi:hypothetical protein